MTAATDRLQVLKTQPGFYIVKRSAYFEGAPIESVEHAGRGFYGMTLLDR